MDNCRFTHSHYRDMLDAAADIFSISTFADEPDETRRLYLRHDVDVSLKNAVALAEIESEMGITSTYFIPINSPYYNLFNDTQLRRVRRLSELGHSIGLHVDERAAYMNGYDDIESMLTSVYGLLSEIVPLEKVLSFHMPSQYEFTRTTAIGDFVNAYSDRFNNGKNVKYLSDSNRHWREGCFCTHLDTGDYHSYQVLVHPVWWHAKPLGDNELFEKIKSTNEEGLEVNLKGDLALFSDL